MALVDLDDEFLELFFNITNSKAPANEIGRASCRERV